MVFWGFSRGEAELRLSGEWSGVRGRSPERANDIHSQGVRESHEISGRLERGFRIPADTKTLMGVRIIFTKNSLVFLDDKAQRDLQRSASLLRKT